MEVVVSRTVEDTARAAANAVLAGLPHDGERPPVLGLATGSSPLGLYRELGRAVEEGRADFSAAHGFALDEYVGLPPGHPEGYREVLLREVCGVIGLAPERLAVPDGSGHDVPTLMAAAAAIRLGTSRPEPSGTASRSGARPMTPHTSRSSTSR